MVSKKNKIISKNNKKNELGIFEQKAKHYFRSLNFNRMPFNHTFQQLCFSELTHKVQSLSFLYFYFDFHSLNDF